MLIYYVYAYLRKDGSPYYIGKGKDDRAYDIRHSVSVPKDKNKIVFLERNLTNVGALAIERRYIRWYGRKDIGTGILRNRTDGGDGSAGLKQTNEHRSKIGHANRGRVFSAEARSNISDGKKGKKLSASHAENIAKALTGMKYGNYKPRTSPNKNKGVPKGPRSVESIEKQKLAITGKPIGPQPVITCPHCNLSGGKSSMKRYHFDNCKN